MIRKILSTFGLYAAAVRLYQYCQKMRNDFSDEHLRHYHLPDATFRNAWLRLKGAPDRLPIPPSESIFAVAGTPNVKWFLHSGKLGALCIRDVLRKHEIEQDSLTSVLDFGCGSGRVIRHMTFLNKAKLFGTDYNPKLIEWCEINLPFASFSLNDLEPPLAYGSGMFDLVYAFSVFTHLHERRQFLWMKEFKRILRSQALLLISLSGSSYLHLLTPDEQRQFRNGQLVVRESGSEGSNDCAAFHPEEFLRRTLADGFDVLDFLPQGAKGNPWQDLYLLRKQS